MMAVRVPKSHLVPFSKPNLQSSAWTTPLQPCLIQIRTKSTGVFNVSMSDSTGLKNDTVPASEKRVKVDKPGQATFDIINHVEQRKSGTQGDNGDKDTTSPHPYQSQTKEEGGEIKAESRRLFTLSIMSGRLVAASTVTSRSCSMPSISVRS